MRPKAVLFVPLLFPTIALAHQGHHHPHGAAQEKQAPVDKKANTDALAAAYAKINGEFGGEVQPILKAKCYDCHSGETKYPWYHRLPGARGLIDGDVAEGRAHIDFSHGFPFAGHGTPLEDLKAIEKDLQDGAMPPFRYRALHWGSALTEGERKKIVVWVKRAEQTIAESSAGRPELGHK